MKNKTQRMHDLRVAQNRAIIDRDITIWKTAGMVNGDADVEQKGNRDELMLHCVLAFGSLLVLVVGYLTYQFMISF